MSRKGSSESHHGWADFIGIALLAAALLLVVAQLSFDQHDIPFNNAPPNQPPHNWIGRLGAYFAWGFFLMFGVTAYLVPVLFAAFGVGYLFNFLGYLREHSRWSLLWAGVLLVSLTGLLHIMEDSGLTGQIRVQIGAHTAGGLLGFLTFEYGFWMLGKIGAIIVYATLSLIGVLFLTNFRLGEWLRARFDGEAEPGAKQKTAPEEAALERKARELEKKKRELEQEVATVTRSGLGQDLQPVPEPNVRDLSVPQAKAKPTKRPANEPVKEIEPADEVIVISPREFGAASTADILGAPSGAPAKPDDKKSEDDANGDSTPEVEKKPAEAQVNITGLAPTRPKPKPKKPITVASTPIIGNYQLPSIDFLQLPDMTAKPTESREELLANARLMQQTLAQFDIPVELGDITKGPTITRYELHPAPGVKLEKISALSNNIAAALKAERINILAPVPGKSSVGVEVPNAVKTKVIMRDLFESDEWRNTKARIPVALGKDVYGHPIIADLAEMPHCLIAGSTGSGKSVCINSIIASLLYRFSPDQLRFVMIDPKVVELQQYNALPHLVVPVVTDPKKVILALRWVVNEMEKRYQIFARVGVRNIATFNSRPKNKPLPPAELELPLKVKKEKVEPGAEGFAVEVDEEIVVPREEDIVIPEKLSYIVVIIDELADLMLVAPADVEMAIARITQMARAAGIHCIVATQRPSVDVITGVIKANIPARIAFQVAAKVDSRTILDAMGADKLLGKGDMLYLPPGSAKLIRVQGALVTDHEIQSVVDFIAKQAKPSYEMEIHQQLSKPTPSYGDESGIDEDEEIIQQCIEVIRSEQKASVSLLQRRLRLGYGRAARIMDELENRGIVGPSNGAEPRDILIDLDVAPQPEAAP
ncbi:MAG: DNA translocase FtsK [Verrucomicrobiota bacterium]|nr:DNA translocase FtsK [Verrucomicrobiota bacterium]MCC6819713.1 DNA translocase FtsK [Limisphaerales bacterium]